MTMYGFSIFDTLRKFSNCQYLAWYTQNIWTSDGINHGWRWILNRFMQFLSSGPESGCDVFVWFIWFVFLWFVWCISLPGCDVYLRGRPLSFWFVFTSQSSSYIILLSIGTIPTIIIIITFTTTTIIIMITSICFQHDWSGNSEVIIIITKWLDYQKEKSWKWKIFF